MWKKRKVLEASVPFLGLLQGSLKLFKKGRKKNPYGIRKTKKNPKKKIKI
jgi:hypothetical protein